VNIYTDSEFKKDDPLIKDFLEQNDVSFKLILTKDLNNEEAEKIIIKRSILTKDKDNKIQTVNG
jgi:hypothetical protein